MQHNIAALSATFDKFNLPYDNDDNTLEDEDGDDASNRSNQHLIFQSKQKGRISRELKLSALTMHLGSVGRVREVNRSDLDSHADACIIGKEALIFQYFDRAVTVSGYKPEWEKRALKTVPVALGWAIPEMGRMALLIVHQSISLPQLEHNVLITMQRGLHYVVVNERPKFQC
jgi:hypothetical protein